MKSYTKNEAPEALGRWNDSRAPWEYFTADREAYVSVKESLIQEQNHLCCYCESAIRDANSHIEHYKPRYNHQNEIYSYANMACSCNGGQGKDDHCGHYKDKTYDDKKFINPSNEKSGPLFKYDIEGGVDPAHGISAYNTERVSYMIEILNLKHSPKLKGARRAHGRSVIEIIDGFLKADAIDQLEEMARYYLIPNNDGELYSFYSLSLQLFGQVGNRVIEER